MNTDQIAAEAAKEIGYFVRSTGGTDEREFERIINAAIEKATEEHREAIEELVDWQNGPPLLSRKWLDGWNGAMEKACALIGRRHERQNI